MTFGKSKKRCQQVGALLIIDEIQPGFGRTENYSDLKLQRHSRRNYIVLNGRWNASWCICSQSRIHGFY
jgi:hypothetical protein